MSFGPYHRLSNPRTQSRRTAINQQKSSEIWGCTPKGGSQPAAQAYDGPLPPDRAGIEFLVAQPPNYTKMSGEVRWTYTADAEHIDISADEDYVRLQVTIMKTRYSCR